MKTLETQKFIFNFEDTTDIDNIDIESIEKLARCYDFYATYCDDWDRVKQIQCKNREILKQLKLQYSLINFIDKKSNYKAKLVEPNWTHF